MTNTKREVSKIKDFLIKQIVVPFLPTYEWRDEGYVGRYKFCELNHKIYLIGFEKEPIPPKDKKK